MEKVLKLGGGRSQSIDITLDYMVTERWSVNSYKNKYVNGKPSGQIPVGYSIHLDNHADYLLEEGGNSFQITPGNSAGGTSAICSLTQEESGEQIDINITTPTTKITNNITINVYKSASSETRGHCVIRSDQPVATDITFKLQIQYGVSSGDRREYTYTLYKDRSFLENLFAIQKEANPRLIDYSYSPQSDSQYIYDVTVL